MTSCWVLKHCSQNLIIITIRCISIQFAHLPRSLTPSPTSLPGPSRAVPRWHLVWQRASYEFDSDSWSQRDGCSGRYDGHPACACFNAFSLRTASYTPPRPPHRSGAATSRRQRRIRAPLIPTIRTGWPKNGANLSHCKYSENSMTNVWCSNLFVQCE